MATAAEPSGHSSVHSRRRHSRPQEAELDITAFMNLMIVLVPILLLGMVFSRITVVDITLPGDAVAEESEEQQVLELIVRDSGLRVNYPAGVLLKQVPLTDDGEHDYAYLSLVLQEVKRQLLEQGVEKSSITLLAEPAVDYQTMVHVMDAVRSFRALVAASVVDAALFPDIVLGEAPVVEEIGS
ncbi:MAG: biopolymer transporter ExbD [Pseudomonadota bacterium]